MIEHGIDKVERQPLVQDPSFIAPSTDDSAGPPAQAALIAVYGTPNDGDQPFYNLATNRVEWRAPITADSFLLEDGELLTEDGNALTE